MPSLVQCNIHIYVQIPSDALFTTLLRSCISCITCPNSGLFGLLNDVLGWCQVGSTGSGPCVARVMMDRVCLQVCARWRPKPLRQQQSAQREGSAAGAPAEQGPAPSEEFLSQVPGLMSGALCEGHVNEHGSTSTSDIMDVAAQMASCKQRCFGTQAQHAGLP